MRARAPDEQSGLFAADARLAFDIGEVLAKLFPTLFAGTWPLVSTLEARAAIFMAIDLHLPLEVGGDAVAVLLIEDAGVRRAGLNQVPPFGLPAAIDLVLHDLARQLGREHARAFVGAPIPSVDLADTEEVALDRGVPLALRVDIIGAVALRPKADAARL